MKIPMRCAIYFTLSFVLIVSLSLGNAFAQDAGTSQDAASKLLDRNLLRNSGAESEPQGDDKIVPDWAPKKAVEAPEYGSVGGEWDWGVSGAPGGGRRYLRISFENPIKDKSVTQRVDVSALAKEIDAGAISAKVSGYIGGMQDSDTGVEVIAVFEDARGKVLGNMPTDEVDTKSLPKPSVGGASMVPREKSGPVPVGTRRIVIQFFAHPTGSSGSYLALADNLSLVLTRGQTQ